VEYLKTAHQLKLSIYSKKAIDFFIPKFDNRYRRQQEMATAYGKELRRRRRERELKHVEVANAARVSMAGLIDIELGRFNITKGTFLRIMSVIESLPEKERAA
jgi:predicted transcriptional regulator